MKEESTAHVCLMSDAMWLDIIQNIQEYTKEVKNDYLLGNS